MKKLISILALVLISGCTISDQNKITKSSTPYAEISKEIIYGHFGASDTKRLTITAKRPIWVLVPQYRAKDTIVRLNPTKSIIISNFPAADVTLTTSCEIRILYEDKNIDYTLC